MITASHFLQRSPADEEAIEVKAFVDLYNISPASLKEAEQFECLAINGGCAISLPNAPAIGLNRVLGLHCVDDLQKARNWTNGQVGNRFLQVRMDTASDETIAWIQANGLAEHGPGWAKLVHDGSPEPAVQCAVPIRLVQTEEAGVFGALMCAGFSFPPSLAGLWSAIVGAPNWSCFFALDGETPIGTGAMYVSEANAWLGGGTTAPDFRNRGVQKALINGRLKHGIANGVSTFAVETDVPTTGKPNISFENLRKLGFRHLYDRKNFRL